MPEIARKDYQCVALRRGGDDDVGKSRRMALAARPIGHRSGKPRNRCIESKDTIAIEMKQRLQPSSQVGAPARRAFTS